MISLQVRALSCRIPRTFTVLPNRRVVSQDPDQRRRKLCAEINAPGRVASLIILTPGRVASLIIRTHVRLCLTSGA
jgi:hypothetical protein